MINNDNSVTQKKFRLWLKQGYGSYAMYVSREEHRDGSAVINGVYIGYEDLADPPPPELIVSFELPRTKGSGPSAA